MKTELIGRVLLRQTAMTEQQLAEALESQSTQEQHERIGQILVRKGHVTGEDVQKALAEQWGIAYIDKILSEHLKGKLVTGLPIEFLRKHRILPLAERDDVVTIAMADPLDVTAYDAAVNILGCPCVRAICAPSAIEDGLSRYFYQDDASTSESLTGLTDDRDRTNLHPEAGAEDLLDLSETAPLVRLVNTLFFQAVHSRASDIHIEPYEQEVKVRFRIDGVLHNRFALSKESLGPLVSRLKVLADLNIAEHRLPQDGRSRIKIGDREIDIRVSTIPTSGGERVVLRLLDKTGARFGLTDLGFVLETEQRFRRLIHMPHGIILLTGPTGSGKTTTLYGAVGELNTEVRNIMTVEDPIEYRLPGVSQMQIKPKIGLTFATCLRHILRQDPDVVMIGEIRDLETARIAIQAALTGHLVVSTLHTNDSASAVTRLVDMGIEPYLVCSSLIAVMAQRLVRLVCQQCKRPYLPSKEERLALSVSHPLSDGKTFYKGAGCSCCSSTGYKGRSGIFELMVLDDELKELIITNARPDVIKQVSLRKGMRTLRQDGVRRVFDGDTTVEEVLRVTQDEVGQSDEELHTCLNLNTYN